MNILLVNPPNCGRSIPEERYGITSLKQIFRGEPLGLEELAGNLPDHEVRIVDLKADPEGLEPALQEVRPEVVGITGVTCEANTMLRLAARVKEICGAVVVVGGIHASNDPGFFNRECVDYIVTGMGKRIFARLISILDQDREATISLSGVIRTRPGTRITWSPVPATAADMVEHRPPAYTLVQQYRPHYVLERLGITMGFVASAYGCPHRCTFCCIRGQTGGRYLTRSPETVVRDIGLLDRIPVIRLVDANTFADPVRASRLAEAIGEAGLKRQYLADMRADTVVRHPDVVQAWKTIGLRGVIIGFEEIDDRSLTSLDKGSDRQTNSEAIALLRDMGIAIVGDFIISPDYDEQDFDRLRGYLASHPVDLPMVTVLTPLPGTPLHRKEGHRIVNHDLDYYTLTNAVTPTRLDEQRFYTLYAELLAESHRNARI